jgi:predicted dehydrogenase
MSEFQREFGIPSAYGWADADALLRDSSIDAVYIPLPNSMHAEWAARALAADKHVLCEKPLALSAAEAERVIAAAEGSGCMLMENFSYQFTPAYAAIERRPVAISAHFSFEANETHKLRYNAELGGGSFLDLGCYGVDFVHRLLDEQMEVIGVEATPPVAERGSWGLVDESCVVHGRTASGVEIEISSSLAAPPRAEFVLRFADGSEDRIERADDTAALLRAFAQMSHSDPADLVRFRRNARVIERVRGELPRLQAP